MASGLLIQPVHHPHHAKSPPAEKIAFNSVIDSGAIYDSDPEVEEFEEARESVYADEDFTVLTPATTIEPDVDLSKIKVVYREYSESELDEDLERCRRALALFLNSRIAEAEDIIRVKLDSSLYCSLGYSLFLFLRSLLTFEPHDMARALDNLKLTVAIASRLRKSGSYAERFGKVVRGSGTVNALKGMNRVQRHAELVYGESLMLKAVLGVVYGSDIMSFIREALNLRSAYAIYKTLSKFLAESANDKTIDRDFTSGVQLGSGLISLVLSLLPNKILRLIEVIGYSGDRKFALSQCAAAGGWSLDSSKLEPGVSAKDEGLRRMVCDMVLMTYHLVISTFIPLTDVNVKFAEKISVWSLNRFPRGVFFLFFSGRLYATQGLLVRSEAQHRKAISSQKDWRQLQHICWWELGLLYLVTDASKAYDAFDFLAKESMWSKCVYNYTKAVCLYEGPKGESSLDAVVGIMQKVPGLMQRIAGKSIPLEKFMARKAKKFIAQGNRLCVPLLEQAYVWNCFEIASASNCRNILSRLDGELLHLEMCFSDPSQYGNPKASAASRTAEFWEDFCLVHLLRAVILMKLAFPNPEHLPEEMDNPAGNNAKTSNNIPRPPPPEDHEELVSESQRSFQLLFRSGPHIRYDHWFIWFGHYEMGRLQKSLKQADKARQEFDKVMSGKNMEVTNQKGKCSLENMLVLRTHSALIAMDMK